MQWRLPVLQRYNSSDPEVITDAGHLLPRSLHQQSSFLRYCLRWGAHHSDARRFTHSEQFLCRPAQIRDHWSDRLRRFLPAAGANFCDPKALKQFCSPSATRQQLTPCTASQGSACGGGGRGVGGQRGGLATQQRHHVLRVHGVHGVKVLLRQAQHRPSGVFSLSDVSPRTAAPPAPLPSRGTDLII